MSDRPHSVDSPGPLQMRTGPLAVLLSLAVSASGCMAEPPSDQAASGTTSKVPEIARRQKHMQDMMKKAQSKEKSPAGPR